MEGKQLRSLAEFEAYDGTWFIVRLGENIKTVHRGFVESWQTHMLILLLRDGRIFEAKEIEHEVR